MSPAFIQFILATGFNYRQQLAIARERNSFQKIEENANFNMRRVADSRNSTGQKALVVSRS